MNFADIIVMLFVGIMLAAAIFFTIRRKRNGKCGCDNCRACIGSCSRKREPREKDRH